MKYLLLGLLCLQPLMLESAMAPRRPKVGVHSAAEAKAIAARETGGQAVSARAIPLNGATGGWEVLVRMPQESQGWRCIVDNDTRAIFRKERIENPGPKKGRKSAK